MNIRILSAAVAAGAVLSVGSIATVHATGQSKMAPGKMAPAPKTAKMAASPVYVCKECKAYSSPLMAKKMGYKDPMGHKLVKMSKAPAGYKDAAKMGKMGKI